MIMNLLKRIFTFLQKVFLTGEFEIISSLKFVPKKFSQLSKTSILPVMVVPAVDFPVTLTELCALRTDHDSST